MILYQPGLGGIKDFDEVFRPGKKLHLLVTDNVESPRQCIMYPLLFVGSTFLTSYCATLTTILALGAGMPVFISTALVNSSMGK